MASLNYAQNFGSALNILAELKLNYRVHMCTCAGIKMLCCQGAVNLVQYQGFDF